MISGFRSHHAGTTLRAAFIVAASMLLIGTLALPRSSSLASAAAETAESGHEKRLPAVETQSKRPLSLESSLGAYPPPTRLLAGATAALGAVTKSNPGTVRIESAIAQQPTSPTLKSSTGTLNLGINVHPLNDDYAVYPPSVILDRVAQLGTTLVRIDIHWPWIETAKPGEDGWNKLMMARLDNFLAETSKRGIRVLAVVTETPCWASSDVGKSCTEGSQKYDWRYPPANPRTLADFMERMVRHTQGRIQYWEVWNEPNLGSIWHNPSAAGYVTLLKAAYAAVKRADPSATVLGGSLAPANSGPGGIYPGDYLRSMYEAGAKGYLDALSYHPYTGGFPPDYYDPSWPSFSYARSVPEVQSIMQMAGDSSPIWITEVGWSTIDNCVASAGCYSPQLLTSETDQAGFLVRAHSMAVNWRFVQSFIVYELTDGGDNATNTEQNFGLFRRNLSPKTSAVEIRALHSWQ